VPGRPAPSRLAIRRSLPWIACAILGTVAVACGLKASDQAQNGDRLALRGPPDSAIPAGLLGTSIRRGRALLVATRDSLPANVGNRLSCVNCHLDGGRRMSGTWVGVYGRYPQYRSRSNAIESIQDRVNECFRRSMNGTRIAPDGPDMRDIVAYFAFLSRGVPVGPPPSGTSPLARWASFKADTAAGRETFRVVCAGCHGPEGGGTSAAPPLWGPQSYNIGAGMARVRTAAAFIAENMPFDRPGSLTDQQAFDVASYVNAQPRPDFADKIYDWPNGDAPPDVAYRTLGADRRAKAP